MLCILCMFPIVRVDPDETGQRWRVGLFGRFQKYVLSTTGASSFRLCNNVSKFVLGIIMRVEV